MIELSGTNFNEEVINSNKLVVVDFWAEWCGPCRMLAPILDDISKEVDPNTVTVGKVNVDVYGNLASENNVRNIPTLLFFKDGVVVDRLVGVASKSAINTIITNNL